MEADAVSDDDKLDFFLRHWKQIVEWSKLRGHAVETLDKALLQALDSLTLAEGTEHLAIDVGPTRFGRLHLPRESHDAWLEFQWQPAALFDRGWPRLIVVWNRKKSTEEVRAAVKRATAAKCDQLGISTYGPQHDYWVRYKEVAVTDEPFDLDEYVRDCADQFRDAWLELRGPLEAAVTSVLGPEKSLT